MVNSYVLLAYTMEAFDCMSINNGLIYLSKVDKNIIGNLKMHNYFWCSIKLIFLSFAPHVVIAPNLFAIAKAVALNLFGTFFVSFLYID